MARLVTLLGDSSTRGSSKKGLCNYSLRKVLATIAIILILAVCTAALAQPGRGYEQVLEPLPPRPPQAYNPWPWFIAFLLLGLAWYPAFKNAKRELSE